MPRIVVTDATFPHLDHERAVAERHGATFEAGQCTTAEDVIRLAQGADALFVQFAPVTARVIETLRPGTLIVRYGIGLDNVDLQAAKSRGIKVTYVPDYATGEVADHTAALALAALRKITRLDASVRAGKWDPVGVCRPMKSFSTSVAGFIGFGRIGREVYARLKPFGFAGIVSDPYADAAALEALGAKAVDLETLISSADVIALHAPLTPATKHVINAERLKRMKPTTVIVNTARGGLIDTAALEKALAENVIAGAALDVFEEEPLPASSRLRELPNVILTPHAAWFSNEAVARLQGLAADEVDRHFSGKPPRCPAPMP